MGVDNKTFYMRLVATTVAILTVMVAVKLLFFMHTDNTVSAKPNDTKSLIISWQDAAKHYSETCTVEGKIVQTKNTGSRCFLNFHSNWKKYLALVIFRNSFSSFPPKPEEYYLDKNVRVTGRIKEYKGRPEIILESSKQIEVID